MHNFVIEAVKIPITSCKHGVHAESHVVSTLRASKFKIYLKC